MRDPRTMLLDIDHSGLHSEPGSREWIITRRSLLVACLSDIKNNRTTGRSVYDEIQQHGGWQHLRDLKGNPFQSFEQFCKSPNGLALGREEIERRLTAQDLAADPNVLAAAPEGTAGPGRGHKTRANSPRLGSGPDTTERIVRRLKRDHPEIADALACGEFKSARAAGIAAGIITPPTPLERVCKLLPKLTAAEMRQLREHIDQVICLDGGNPQ